MKTIDDGSGGQIPVDTATFEQLIDATTAARDRAETHMAEVERLAGQPPSPNTLEAQREALAQVKIEMDDWWELMQLARSRTPGGLVGTYDGAPSTE